MKINIGLLNSNPGWEILLNQEGIPFEIIDLSSFVKNSGTYSLLIVHNDTILGDPKILTDHIKDGGLVFFESGHYAKIFNRKLRKKYVKYIFPDAGSKFSDLGVIDFYSDLSFIKGNSNNLLDKNLKIIWNIIGKGAIAVIPFDVDSLVNDKSYCRKRFPAERPELPSEIVSKVTKGKIRILICRIIKEMFTFKQLPFIQKWYYNSEAESIFLFRIDTDFCNEEDAVKLHETLKFHNIEATWFIDTESDTMLSSTYSKLSNQEIAFHCDRHRIFRDFKKNHNYIKQGLEKLDKNNISVQGYAAPYGEWNPELGKVLENIGFTYSSEFSLDYDDLPFFPYFDSRSSLVLQIPVHPVSPGRLRRSHFTRKEMVDYYKNVINRKLENSEPVIFYHHPSHQLFEVINEIFGYVNKLDLPKMTFHQFAIWWKYREQIKLGSDLKDSTLMLSSDNEKDFYVKITLNGKYSIIPYTSKIDLNSMTWKTEPEKKELSLSRNIRKFYWRDLLNDYESYKGKKKK